MKGGMSVAAALLIKQKEQASEKAICIGDYCVIKFDEIVSFQKRFVPNEVNGYRILVMLKNRDEIEIPFENGKVERDEAWKEIMKVAYVSEQLS